MALSNNSHSSKEKIVSFVKKYHILILFFIGFLLRVVFALRIPIANDEAFYSYDAFNINQGLVPYRDFFTKSVPFLYVLSFWQNLFGEHIIANRFFTICVSLLSGYVLYKIVQLFNKRVATAALTIFLLDAYVASRSIFVATNFPFILSYLLAIYVFLQTLRTKRFSLAILTGILITLSYFTRQSGVFLLPLIVLYTFFTKKMYIPHNIKKNIRYIGLTVLSIATFFTCFGIIYYIAGTYIMGFTKANEFSGINFIVPQYEQTVDVQTSIITPSKIITVLNSVLNTVFLSPIIFIGLLLIPLLYAPNKILKRKLGRILFALFGLVVILYSLFYMKSFVIYNTRELTNVFLSVSSFLVAAMIINIMFYVGFIRFYNKKIKRQSIFNELFVLGFFACLLIFGAYIMHIRFDYIIELYPFFAILSGLALYKLLKQKVILLAPIIGVVTISLVFSFFVNITYLNTGSHTLAEISETVSIIQKESTSTDTIFTGFPTFALMAERHVVMDISHPAWYGYEFVDHIRDDFLPPIQDVYHEMVQNPPAAAVIDTFTYDSYMRRYPEIKKFIENNYTLRREFSNFSLYVYKKQ